MTIPFLPYSDDDIFQLSNVALIPWVLLVVLPYWRYTLLIAKVFALAFAVLYVLLMLDTIYFHPIDGAVADFGSLDGVHKLFSQKPVVLGGWVHYIVFDLWTGIGITNDAVRNDFPWLLLLPTLFSTMMFGPLGLLLYLILKASIEYLSKSKED